MSQIDIRKAVGIGLLFGVVAVSICAIGMIETFDQRDVIANLLTLGQLLLYSTPLLAGYFAVRAWDKPKAIPTIIMGLTAGFTTSLPVIALIALTQVWDNIRDAFVNVSPALVEILTFGLGPLTGSIVLAVVMTVLGLAGAVFHMLPEKVERPLLIGIASVLVAGILSEVWVNILRPRLPRDVMRLLFSPKGITLFTAVIVFVIAVVITIVWDAGMRDRYQARRATRTPAQQKQSRTIVIILSGILILLLPMILGKYLTEVLDVVGIFVLMGLGLNIVVGFAGLLDLGYVAFFAIGAYVMGLLTTDSGLAIANLSFWTALPFSILVAVSFGIMLGVPVLRMRGDYLAIVTLGFGEIIRVLAVSDLLKSVIGGAQGITQIRKPEIHLPGVSFTFVEPIHFYYIIIIACLLAAFVSARLRDARLGRRWMALREDEDVAEAMGIRLVSTKLLAFAIGAAFSGFAGAIFAARLSSIFPHSFNLLISINVLSLIIVGGIGSLPGVVVGALVLIGLPEILREFAEYRLLLYGALLIATMLLRPEGLWPSAIQKRELHAEEEIAEREGTHPEQVHDLI